MAGSLIVVGTGIGLACNMTLETKAIIQGAEKLIFLSADGGTENWLPTLNPTAESIFRFYSVSKGRLETYREMTEYVLSFVRVGKRVCFAVYGHPGVFVYPAHEAIIKARAEGYSAEMKPAVSAEDCLFADLGIDPGRVGCQSFEATDLLVYGRRFDATSVLVLWQVAVLGQLGYRETPSGNNNITVLRNSLLKDYPTDHPAIVYEARAYSICDPKILRVTIGELAPAMFSPISTLVVPPREQREANLDMIKALGIPEKYIVYRRAVKDGYDPTKPNYVEYKDES